jgi:uncharacterized protein (TIGR02246 family)
VKLVFSTPEAAEEAFYRAFVKRDVDAMMAVWADDDNISCVHPAGHRLQGQEAVRKSWERIFEHSPTLDFRITDETHIVDGSIAVHVLNEHIRLGNERQHQPPVIVTNVYRLGENGWRMVAHHASTSRAQGPAPSGVALH